MRDHAAPPHTIALVSRSGRWSVRHDVRYALLRNRHLPLARALQFLPSMSPAEQRDLARDPSVPAQLRSYIGKQVGKK